MVICRIIKIVATMTPVAILLTGCSTGLAASTTVTIVSTSVRTVTASPSPAAGPVSPGETVASTSSSSSSTPGSASAGAYLAGDLTVQFPTGDAGAIAVVAQGPRTTTSGTKWPVVVRNNSGSPVCDIKGTGFRHIRW